jgi:DNA-binding PadR family transcriptional regulator
MAEAANQPIHGYALTRLIRKKYGVSFAHSTIYPALNDLENKGLMESAWQFQGAKARKLYTLTNKGKLLLLQTPKVLAFVNQTMEVKPC